MVQARPFSLPAVLFIVVWVLPAGYGTSGFWDSLEEGSSEVFRWEITSWSVRLITDFASSGTLLDLENLSDIAKLLSFQIG